MTSAPPPADDQSEQASTPSGRGSHLKRVRLRGNSLAWIILSAGVSSLGLFLITSLSNTPWLFLLYPLFIGALLASLGLIALHLLQRL